MIKIKETTDYRPLIPFFIENGLEFEEGEEYGGDEIVMCWRADEFPGNDPSPAPPPGAQGANFEARRQAHPRLVGGAVLAKREGEYICDGIAVAPEHRKDGLGKELLDLIVAEAKSRGAAEVFLVARAPGFFAKSGFVPVPREEAPDFFECFTCPQYGKTCYPEVMRLGNLSGIL
ncbi:MAG: GNAT family N-acetyltransferase [Clostridiales Family XIII bacterium]|nr:GNAT family N-acetyltransferase [Clostridiales Family XIII bacterium]